MPNPEFTVHWTTTMKSSSGPAGGQQGEDYGWRRRFWFGSNQFGESGSLYRLMRIRIMLMPILIMAMQIRVVQIQIRIMLTLIRIMLMQIRKSRFGSLKVDNCRNLRKKIYIIFLHRIMYNTVL